MAESPKPKSKPLKAPPIIKKARVVVEPETVVKTSRNRLMELTGEINISLLPRPGENGHEEYVHSNIAVRFDDGDPTHDRSETIRLPPQRVQMLLQILDYAATEFMREYYDDYT